MPDGENVLEGASDLDPVECKLMQELGGRYETHSGTNYVHCIFI